MDPQLDPKSPAQAYDESVRLEREAWHALHSHAPGSPERERAWDAWSRSIVRTNHAWRKLTASRILGTGLRALPATPQHHANA